TERGIQLSKFKRVATDHIGRLSTLSIGERFVSRRVERAIGQNTVQSINIDMEIWDVPTNGFLGLQGVIHGDSNDVSVSPNHVSQFSIPGQDPQTVTY